MQRQHEALTKGVGDDLKLEMAQKRDEDGISLVNWSRLVQRDFEKKGLDTVFRIGSVPDANGNYTQEIYIFEEWGKVKLEDIKNWTDSLTDEYDVENLQLSADAILNSLGKHLSQKVMSIASKQPTGPELFFLAVGFMSYLTEETIRQKSNELGNLRLKDIPGENVRVLVEKVSELAREIESSGRPPSDLLQLCSRPFTKGTVEDFKIHAFNINNKVKTHDYGKDWESLMIEHANFYQELIQSNDWPPAKGANKEDTDSQIQGLVAKMDEVSKKVDANLSRINSNQGSSGNGDGGGRGKRKCFRCQSEDHVIRDCPLVESNNGDAWKRVPPNTANNEPKEKTVDGIVFKWCGKCRGNRGHWNGGDKAHFTEEHRSGGRAAQAAPNTGNENQTNNSNNQQNGGNQQEQANLGYVNAPLAFGFLAVVPQDDSHTKELNDVVPDNDIIDFYVHQDKVHPKGRHGNW
eukprot:scaffold9224_cov170-Cylindrotheca_fusiformis.AAC.2